MEQYPDTIVITIITPATKDEATGIYTSGGTSTQTLKCRAEINGVGRKIPGPDGALMDFAFICYLPKMVTIIPPDSDYTLTSAFNGTFTGKLKRVSNGQLNSRLWL